MGSCREKKHLCCSVKNSIDLFIMSYLCSYFDFYVFVCGAISHAMFFYFINHLSYSSNYYLNPQKNLNLSYESNTAK